jgi:hypothetical protein
MMEPFVLNEDQQLVACLIMLCKITKNSDPIAYAQYKAHLKLLKEHMMKEFDYESLGNNSFH